MNETPRGADMLAATRSVQAGRLTEATALLRRLLRGERVSHDGRFYRLRDALVAPAPGRDPFPILIGGMGPNKTLPIVAKHADMWNAHGDPRAVALASQRIADLCRQAGRDDREIERSVYLNVVVRKQRRAARAAWTRYAAEHRPVDGENLADAVGTAVDVAERMDAYAAVGVSHLIWVFRSPYDTATMDRLQEIRRLVEEGRGRPDGSGRTR
jgi:alkanesulfonate monooxygenase SsuD/methylene tetrahydromethanopterin reductase-like flavin-dependent oxidoreductase (luciferase family)